MLDVEKMTDEELEKAIVKKYGENWNPNLLDANDAIVKEWIRRLTTGYFSEPKNITM